MCEHPVSARTTVREPEKTSQYGESVARRLTPRGAERRQQILEFATARFAENGYHPTSVADIVTGLGVGKGVFYWYFESKEQLLSEILASGQRELRRLQDQAIAGEPDPIRRIELGLRATVAWAHAHRDLYRLTQFAATEDRFAPVLRRGQEVAVADVVVHLQEAVDNGQIRSDDPVMLAHAMVGVVGHLVRTFIHEAGRPADEVADAAVDFCLDGALC